MSRRRRGYRMNGWTMDDLAKGDLVGDRADEPRIGIDQAIEMLAGSTSLSQSQSVLALVRGRDRYKVIRRAEQLRGRREAKGRRSGWHEPELPFGEEVGY